MNRLQLSETSEDSRCCRFSPPNLFLTYTLASDGQISRRAIVIKGPMEAVTLNASSFVPTLLCFQQGTKGSISSCYSRSFLLKHEALPSLPPAALNYIHLSMPRWFPSPYFLYKLSSPFDDEKKLHFARWPLFFLFRDPPGTIRLYGLNKFSRSTMIELRLPLKRLLQTPESHHSPPRSFYVSNKS